MTVLRLRRSPQFGEKKVKVELTDYPLNKITTELSPKKMDNSNLGGQCFPVFLKTRKVLFFVPQKNFLTN